MPGWLSARQRPEQPGRRWNHWWCGGRAGVFAADRHAVSVHGDPGRLRIHGKARRRFLVDRLMTKVGLSGKSFVPLMSSFACAVPGIMATRVIENRRDRMTTILVAPLMSCSARQPVYVLMATAFIPATSLVLGWELPGIVMFGMTFLGAAVAVPIAWLLKKTLFRRRNAPVCDGTSQLQNGLSPGVVLNRVYHDQAMSFVVRAGTLIMATTVLIWGAGYFPGDHSQVEAVQAQIDQLREASKSDAAKESELQQLVDEQNRLRGDLLEQSFLGRFGKAVVEPAP